MKLLKVILMWLPSLFFLAVALSCVSSILSPVPQLQELHIVKGKIIDYEQRYRRSGKTKRCEEVITIAQSEGRRERVVMRCAAQKLSSHIGSQIVIWLEPYPWYRFEQIDYHIYQVQVDGVALFRYDRSLHLVESHKWLLLIIGLLFAGWAVIHGYYYGWRSSLEVYRNRSDGLVDGVQAIERSSYAVKEFDPKCLSMKPMRAIHILVGAFSVLWLGCCLYLMSAFFIVMNAAPGWPFMLVGMIGILLTMIVVNPREYLFDKTTRYIGQVDYFCDPVMHKTLGKLESFSINEVRGGERSTYCLIANCEAGRYFLIQDCYLENIEKMQHQLSEYFGIDAEIVSEVSDAYSAISAEITHIYPSLSGPPGILLFGGTIFGIVGDFLLN